MGSSPLTRGKQSRKASLNPTDRLIPAHAGKTWLMALFSCQTRAHPRSRGENGRPIASHARNTGSSPLTRGKPKLRVDRVTDARLIPAHAGKTFGVVGRGPVGGAHPRSRGENACMARLMFSAPGSSPLTRGKPAGFLNVIGVGRLIPAHAGKTALPFRMPSGSSAHPRSRGENSPGSVRAGDAGGSSPLTRGKQLGIRRVSTYTRLIPAHAGKTALAALGIAICGAHPRSRGENLLFDNVGKELPGSSPLTRGKRPPWVRRVAPGGLIPAHAGKTRWSVLTKCSSAAHPRSRGENPIPSMVRDT